MTILNLMKLTQSCPNRYKTLWEKEKLLVTSNFSFSYSVFKRLVLQTRKNQGLFGKGLSVRFVFKKVQNSVGKGENANNQHFYLLPQCFQKPFLFYTLVKKPRLNKASGFLVNLLSWLNIYISFWKQTCNRQPFWKYPCISKTSKVKR